MPLPADRPFVSEQSSPAGQILHAGRIRRSRGHPRRRIDSYALVYVIEGVVDYADEGGTRARLEPGDLMLLFPGFAQGYEPPPGAAWSEQFLTFRGPVFELWEQLGLLDRRRPLWRLTPVGSWVRRMIAVTAGQTSPTADECLEQTARLQQLLAAMRQRQRLAPPESADEAWLRRARRAIETGGGAKPDWSVIARRCGLGGEGFRKRFRRLSGESPARFFLRARMQRADWLVTQSHLTNREIAELCGFSDEFHFSKQYRTMMGEPPSARRAVHGPPGERHRGARRE